MSKLVQYFSHEEQTGVGRQEISLWSDMLSANIRSRRRYLQLSRNIYWPIEGCQTGRVNKKMTSISHNPKLGKSVSHKDQASGCNSDVDEKRVVGTTLVQADGKTESLQKTTETF